MTFALIPGGGGDPLGVAPTRTRSHMVAMSHPGELADRLEAFRRDVQRERRGAAQ